MFGWVFPSLTSSIFIFILNCKVICDCKEILSTHQVVTQQETLMLGGFFPVHARGSKAATCGRLNRARGIQRMEALRFAVDRVNADRSLLPNHRLGYIIFDTCSDSIRSHDLAMDLTFSSNAGRLDCTQPASIALTNGSYFRANSTLVGIIGGSISDVSIELANVFRYSEIPQISYASTSEALSNKHIFPYFLRTVPPDSLQAKALADIVLHFNWTYISTVHSTGQYGTTGIRAFEKEINKKSNSICIATKEELTSDNHKDVLNNLLAKPEAHAVILFVTESDARKLLELAEILDSRHDFVWIASDGWGAQWSVVRDTQEAALGALTVELQSDTVPFFQDYFTGLNPANNKENVWFDEFWESEHQCKMGTQSKTNDNNGTTVIPDCTGSEPLDTPFVQESKTNFVYTAVFALASAVDKIIKDCQQTPCKDPFQNSGHQILKTLLSHTHKDDFETKISFDKNGDSPGYYNILNFQKNSETGAYEYKTVGTWEENRLDLKEKLIKWRSDGTQSHGNQSDILPQSVCSQPCELGYIKVLKSDCCWNCVPCKAGQYVLDEETCADCPEFFAATEDWESCSALPLVPTDWSEASVVGPCAFAVFGFIITATIFCVFHKYRDTAVVRATGREVCLVTLSGCVLCYSAPFIILATPSQVLCSFRRLCIGIGPTVVYASLFTKTVRIYRLFKYLNPNGVRWTSIKSQLLLICILVIFQLLCFAIWMASEPPGVHKQLMTLDGQQFPALRCDAKSSSVVGFLVFSAALIVATTVLSLCIRNAPSRFNEVKNIGLTMYATCVLWLCFIPFYFVFSSNFTYQEVALSTSICLSATTVQGFLFLPKLVIIFFYPEKNQRSNVTKIANRGQSAISQLVAQKPPFQNGSTLMPTTVTHSKTEETALLSPTSAHIITPSIFDETETSSDRGLDLELGSQKHSCHDDASVDLDALKDSIEPASASRPSKLESMEHGTSRSCHDNELPSPSELGAVNPPVIELASPESYTSDKHSLITKDINLDTEHLSNSTAEHVPSAVTVVVDSCTNTDHSSMSAVHVNGFHTDVPDDHPNEKLCGTDKALSVEDNLKSDVICNVNDSSIPLSES